MAWYFQYSRRYEVFHRDFNGLLDLCYNSAERHFIVSELRVFVYLPKMRKVYN